MAGLRAAAALLVQKPQSRGRAPGELSANPHDMHVVRISKESTRVRQGTSAGRDTGRSVRGRLTPTLTDLGTPGTFEALKVWGGEIHAVNAFFRILPEDTPRGWEGVP